MFRPENPIFNDYNYAHFQCGYIFEKDYVVYKQTFERDLRTKQPREEV
jgi:hypothetical protein